mmetsp:Transcript_22656/g.51922  ORF Transcript_22656/g.51922 Transcript_22656/m.51922 type:complete len:83 (+) Transcript_22656:142-390(+)
MNTAFRLALFCALASAAMAFAPAQTSQGEYDLDVLLVEVISAGYNLAFFQNAVSFINLVRHSTPSAIDQIHVGTVRDIITHL